MKADLFEEVIETKEKMTNEIRKADAGKMSSMLTNICLAFLLLLILFLSMWDVTLTFNTVVTKLWLTAFTYLIVNIIYQTKYQGGYSAGRKTDEYRSAAEHFETTRKNIVDEHRIDDLNRWCKDYSREELIAARQELISPYMLYEDYLEKYAGVDEETIRIQKIPRGMKRAVIKANNLQSIRLNADQLMKISYGKKLFGSNRNPLPKNGSERMQEDYIRNAVNRFFTMIFCGFVSVQIFANPSLETVFTCMIYMSPVIGAFVGGYNAGYRNATNHDKARIEAQTGLLERFFEERGGIE